ncbi:MAG: hypothetical protein GX248_06090 [Peptococcaceae bacterium]|nr:hypothetical protein [Peptococcaceae bacterium]
MSTGEKNWKCAKCDKQLVLKNTDFFYLGHKFTYDVLNCPQCGKVLIPKELAEGRMAELEEALEDK